MVMTKIAIGVLHTAGVSVVSFAKRISMTSIKPNHPSHQWWRAWLLSGLVLFVTSATVQANTEIGTVDYVRGVATAQHPERGVRIAGKGLVLFEGDVLSTGKNSFAVLDLSDGSKMTLRPETQFGVEQFKVAEEESSAIMRLFKGGLRALSGSISKKNPNTGLKLHTPVSTIGIRGTEFDARLCGTECQEEAQQLQRYAAKEATSQVLARAVMVRGKVSARSSGVAARIVTAGAPLYEGDQVLTGPDSHVVLVFPDNSRFTLESNTRFVIDRYDYRKEAPEEGRSLMSLIRGGLRAVTGLLGKSNPQAFSVRTPVTTIGVRGTGFDLRCQGRCFDYSNVSQSLQPQPQSLAIRLLDQLISQAIAQAMPQGDGLFASVWNGSIEIGLNGGTLVLEEGRALFLKNNVEEPIIFDNIPLFLQDNTSPRPDEVEADTEALFTSETQETSEAGLYVSVYDGHVQVEDELASLDLGAGEAAYYGTDADTAIRLDIFPVFQELDSVPSPAEFDENFQALMELVGDEIQRRDGQFSCEVR